MSLEAMLLKVILETMFEVLLNMNDWSPSMMSSLRNKQNKYRQILKDYGGE